MRMLYQLQFDIELTAIQGVTASNEHWQQLVQVLDKYCNEYGYSIRKLDMTLEQAL